MATAQANAAECLDHDHVGTTGLAPLADAPGTYVFES
jgi:hypothetical protein